MLIRDAKARGKLATRQHACGAGQLWNLQANCHFDIAARACNEHLPGQKASRNACPIHQHPLESRGRAEVVFVIYNTVQYTNSRHYNSTKLPSDLFIPSNSSHQPSNRKAEPETALNLLVPRSRIRGRGSRSRRIRGAGGGASR